MLFKKIIQINKKLLAVLVFVVFFFSNIQAQVFAMTNATLGSYQYNVFNDGEIQGFAMGGSKKYSSSIDKPVGGSNTLGENSLNNIIVADTEGNKVQLSFDSNGFLNYVTDSKSGKVYQAKTGGAAMGTTEMQNSLNDLSKASGYKGNLYQDVIKERNVFYNNQLIDKLSTGGKCEVKDTLQDSYAQTVNDDYKSGIITLEDARAINDAIRGNRQWTLPLAKQFKGAMNSNLSTFQTAFFWGDAQQAVECAFINAASQENKDKAITILQNLNETGEGINSLTSDELNTLVNTTNAGVTSGGGIGSATQVGQEVSGAVNQASRDLANESLATCLTWPSITQFDINLSACFAELLYFFLSILALFLGVVGGLFNLVFDVTLVNMAKNVSNIGIVTAGWATIRDFANILFIFMLLYLAISTILQLDEHGVKHGLSRLIIGAVLINFSLFFVKIPIDVSNILAIEIYNKINIDGHSTIENDGSVGLSFGLGDALMAIFSPQQVFGNGSLDPKTIIEASTSGVPTGQIGWNLQENPVTTFAMGIIIIFTALLVFLAVIIIFIKRFITLVMLMIFSPLAFAGMAIPNHDIEHQISEKFWNSLIKESFYAPVFMFMMYLTIRTGMALNNPGVLAGSESKGILANLTTVPVTNIISYSVVMGMMIFSLTVSETMGVKGASGAIKFFDGARGMATGWAATNTIGRIAWTRLNKGQSAEDLQRDASGARGLVRQQLARLQISTFANIGKGFGEKVSKLKEYKTAYDHEHHGETSKRVDDILDDRAGQGLFRTNTQAVESQWDDRSVNDKAKMLVMMKAKIENEEKKDPKDQVSEKIMKGWKYRMERLEHRSTPEDQKKIDKIIRGGLPEHTDQVIQAFQSKSPEEFRNYWENLPSGVRRFVASDIKHDDVFVDSDKIVHGEKIEKDTPEKRADKEEKWKAIALGQDSASAEYLIKNPETDDRMKDMIRAEILGSKLRVDASGILSDPKADSESKKVALKQLWALKDLAKIMSDNGMREGADILPIHEDTVKRVVDEYKSMHMPNEKTYADYYDNQKRYVKATPIQSNDLKKMDDYKDKKEKIKASNLGKIQGEAFAKAMKGDNDPYSV